VLIAVEEHEDGLLQVAGEHPELKFGLIQGSHDLKPNVARYILREPQAAFLAGAAAGLLGHKKIGYVSGIEIPVLLHSKDAVERGLKYVNPQGQVLSQFTGDFDDAALAKEAALALIRQGATILMPHTGAAWRGVAEAIAAKGVKGISANIDRCGATPYWQISHVANLEPVIPLIVEEITTGTWKPTTTKTLGLESVSKVTLCGSDAGADVKAKLEQIKQDLISGKIQLPADY
jgi:basic membrane protein A